MWQGYYAKKMDQIAHFWPEWWFKLFTSAYRGSPPPAVFQNKYQSYKYERNTAGKSASAHPAPQNTITLNSINGDDDYIDDYEC